MQQVHNDNVLIKWCKERGYILSFKEGGPKVEETHLLLNGGRIRLPDEAHDEFLEKMADAVVRERAWLYVVEKKTNPGRFFLELDLLLWDKRLTKEDIINVLLPPFSRVMREAFPNHDTKAIICIAPCVAVEKTEAAAASTSTSPAVREKIKNGVHIVWPNIIVSPDTAWTLRAWLLYELTSKADMSALGELCDSWDNVIDPCVFGKNGLRMIWNRKASTCKVCNGVPFQRWISEKRQRSKGERGPARAEAIVSRPDIIPCKVCNTFDNKIDEGRPYEPVAVIDCEDAETESQRISVDPIYALKMTSIRVASSTVKITPYATPDRMTRLIEPWRKKTTRDVKQMKAPVVDSGRVKRKRDDGRTISSLLSVGVGDKAYAVLAKYVTEVLNCGVVSIKTDEHNHFFLVNTTSNECSNKGSPHSRSTIYLVFQPDGYYQKCWCRKGCVYRPGGVSCENYRSPLMQYVTGDVSEIRQLFSARFAREFPFVFGRTPVLPTTAEPLDPFKPNVSSSSQQQKPSLVDSYPELSGRQFSEVQKIIATRMEAWKKAQTAKKETPK